MKIGPDIQKLSKTRLGQTLIAVLIAVVYYHIFIIQNYLEAGADFTETNTFNGTSISHSDYGTQHLVSYK